eukprot:9064346-Pyramimonas_sp.AAC.1
MQHGGTIGETTGPLRYLTALFKLSFGHLLTWLQRKFDSGPQIRDQSVRPLFTSFEGIASVAIDDGIQKYVLVQAEDPNSPEGVRYFVVGNKEASYHKDAVRYTFHSRAAPPYINLTKLNPIVLRRAPRASQELCQHANT